MARPYRVARKPKEPVAPVVYAIDPEIETTISRIVRFNPVQFGWSNNFKLGGVLVRGSTPKETGGCVTLARFVKVPPLWHGLTGYDAIVRVEEWAWRRLSPEQKEALVTHELCHGSMSDKGALKVQKHDLEEFGFVVRKYGAWQENIALFDRQLSMFEPGLGTAAATEGAQTVVPFGPRSKAERKAVEIATAAANRIADRLPEGTSATVTAAGRSATIHGRGKAVAEPTDESVDGIECVGNNHVPGCHHFDQPTADA